MKYTGSRIVKTLFTYLVFKKSDTVSVTLALKRIRQGEHEFKVNLGYRVRFCLKEIKNKRLLSMVVINLKWLLSILKMVNLVEIC